MIMPALGSSRGSVVENMTCGEQVMGSCPVRVVVGIREEHPVIMLLSTVEVFCQP